MQPVCWKDFVLPISPSTIQGMHLQVSDTSKLEQYARITDAADRKVLVERRGTKERIPYFVSNKPGVALDTAVEVNPGDSIIVVKAGIVYVLGDVARPGSYTMTNNET